MDANTRHLGRRMLDVLQDETPLTLGELLKRASFRRGYSEALLALEQMGFVRLDWDGD